MRAKTTLLVVLGTCSCGTNREIVEAERSRILRDIEEDRKELRRVEEKVAAATGEIGELLLANADAVDRIPELESLARASEVEAAAAAAARRDLEAIAAAADLWKERIETIGDRAAAGEPGGAADLQLRAEALWEILGALLRNAPFREFDRRAGERSPPLGEEALSALEAFAETPALGLPRPTEVQVGAFVESAAASLEALRKGVDSRGGEEAMQTWAAVIDAIDASIAVAGCRLGNPRDLDALGGATFPARLSALWASPPIGVDCPEGALRRTGRLLAALELLAELDAALRSDWDAEGYARRRLADLEDLRAEVIRRVDASLEERRERPIAGAYRQTGLRLLRGERIVEDPASSEGFLVIEPDRVVWELPKWRVSQVYAFPEPGTGDHLAPGPEDRTVPLRWVSIENKGAVSYDRDAGDPSLIVRSAREGGGVVLRAGDGKGTAWARFVRSEDSPAVASRP